MSIDSIRKFTNSIPNVRKFDWWVPEHNKTTVNFMETTMLQEHTDQFQWLGPTGP